MCVCKCVNTLYTQDQQWVIGPTGNAEAKKPAPVIEYFIRGARIVGNSAAFYLFTVKY